MRLNCALPLEPFLSYSCILYPPTQQQYRQQHHEARFPSEKKKVETQIGQIGANQENWAASIARAGAREPPWGSGSPRLRRRRRRNKRRSPQPSTARSAREGRRSESSCEFFFAPPLPSAPQPAGRRSFTSFRAERQVLGLPSIDVADPSHPPQWRPAFAQLQNLCLLSLALSLSQEVQA